MTVRSVRAKYDAANLEAARIIAADPERYPGGMQEWAQRVLARIERERLESVGPLFRMV